MGPVKGKAQAGHPRKRLRSLKRKVLFRVARKQALKGLDRQRDALASTLEDTGGKLLHVAARRLPDPLSQPVRDAGAAAREALRNAGEAAKANFRNAGANVRANLRNVGAPTRGTPPRAGQRRAVAARRVGTAEVQTGGSPEAVPGVYLGMSVSPVRLPAELAKAHGTRGGLRVMSVVPGGPADRAGLQQGDTLLTLEGRPLLDVPSLLAQLSPERVGQSLNAKVLRAGATRDVTLPVEVRP